MKIVWTDFAIENLKNIFDYYSIRGQFTKCDFKAR